MLRLLLLRPSALDSRDNALNMFRLFLALMVLFSHAEILAGVGDGFVWEGQHLGAWAVVFFFAISGFLISGSRERSDGARYLINRIGRIYPGYLLSLLMVVLIFAPIAHLVQHGSFDGYLTTPVTPFQHVWVNILLVISTFNVGDTLAEVPYPGAWNGSLWSLQYEFYCYLLIGVFLSWKYMRKHVWPTIVLFVVFTSLYALRDALAGYWGGDVSFGLMLQMAPYFFGGAIVYKLRDSIPFCFAGGLLSLFVSLFLIDSLPGCGKQVAAPFIAYFILWLASVMPSPRLLQIHDVSYGVYIFHFPVIQLLIVFGVHRIGFPGLLVCSILITLVLATLSWLLVERAVMRWIRGRRPWGDLRAAAR